MEKERCRSMFDHQEGDRKGQETKTKCSSPSVVAKRKKHRDSKRCSYLQDWLEKSRTFQQSEESSSPGYETEPVSSEAADNITGLPKGQSHPYWTSSTVPVVGQRLIAAVSDPSGLQRHIPVCGYNSYQPATNTMPYPEFSVAPQSYHYNPFSYSVESVSLPLYPMFSNASIMPQNMYKSSRLAPLAWSKGKSRKMNKGHPFVFPPAACENPHQHANRNILNSVHHGALHNPKESQTRTQLPLPSSSASDDQRKGAGLPTNNQDFASLPGNIAQKSHRPAQRRNSDPGSVSTHAPKSFEWSKHITNKMGVQRLPHQIQESTKSFPVNGLDVSEVAERLEEELSSDSSGSTVHLEEKHRQVMGILEEMNDLKEVNRKLYRELHETRTELESLKVHMANRKHLGPEYEPGMLSDLVREIREAAQLREDALVSRVRLMISTAEEGRGSPRTGFSLNQRWSHSLRQHQPYLPEPVESPTDGMLGDRSSRGSRDLEDLKNQLHQALAEKSQTNERLVRVEEQLQNLRLQPSPQEPSTFQKGSDSPQDACQNGEQERIEDGPASDQVLELEREKLELRRDLQEALAGRKDTEAHIQKLERLVTILRKKINAMNGLSVDGNISEPHDSSDKAATPVDSGSLPVDSNAVEPSSLENTSESLVSVCSSNLSSDTRSVGSPQVTILGPVTDL